MTNSKMCEYGKMLTPYFGKVGEGMHKTRVFDIAIMDVIMSAIGALIISYVFKTRFIYTLVGVFLAGIVLHRIFCIRTTVDKLLFQ